MISRRKYFGIVLMMGLLFIIFLFSVIVNEEGSFYDINEYVIENRPSGAERWKAYEEEETVLLFGGQREELKNVVTQWCCYTKRRLEVFPQWEMYETSEANQKPSMVLVDMEGLELSADCRELEEFLEQGIPLVFLNLPKPSEIIASVRLKEILGIDYVASQAVEVEGVQLFDGFFLGGAATYKAETEKEEQRQDLDLTVPWYIMAGGTKTYMIGLMDTEEVKLFLGLEKEDGATGYLPSLIWRNSYKNSMVFAVCGDYMSSMAGLGILNSFCYEMKQYDIYPVVNAQNVLIQNFPNFSGENEEKLLDTYSRTPSMYFQGIMWPSVSALAKLNEYKLTCFFKPQFDYLDGILPNPDEVPFYLQQLRQLDSEAGMALSYKENADFDTMLEEDTVFYESLDSSYQYQTVFAEEADLQVLQKYLQKNRMLQKVVTVSSEYNAAQPLFDYITDSVTLQRTTGNAEEHSYMDDFTVRGIETALLYSNILVDLHNAVWPQGEDDEWQNLYDSMASNVRTYWSAYRNLEQTTLSESDFRIRTLLNLDYSHEREGNTVTLRVKQGENETFFMLRTHEEKIVGIRGGKYEKLETGIYLITAKEAVVEIDLGEITLKEQKKR